MKDKNMELFANEKPICRCKYGLFTFVDSEVEKKAIHSLWQNTRNCMAILFYPTYEKDKRHVFFEIEYTYNRESLIIELAKIQSGDDTVVVNGGDFSMGNKILGSIDLSFDDVLNNLSHYAYELYNKAVIQQATPVFVQSRWCRLSGDFNRYSHCGSKLPRNLFVDYDDKEKQYNYANEIHKICYTILGDIITDKISGILRNKIECVIKEVVDCCKNQKMCGILSEEF